MILEMPNLPFLLVALVQRGFLHISQVGKQARVREDPLSRAGCVRGVLELIA